MTLLWSSISVLVLAVASRAPDTRSKGVNTKIHDATGVA